MAVGSKQQNAVQSAGAGPAPRIHPSAVVVDSVVGSYTDIGSNWRPMDKFRTADSKEFV